MKVVAAARAPERGPLRVLTLCHLFPNPACPHQGIFVWERVRRVAARVPLRVVAPVPRSPLDPFIRAFRPGFRRGRPAPPREEEGLWVARPPVWSPPGVGKWLEPWFFARSLGPFLARRRREFPFNLLDAHFGFPEGAAAALLAARFGVPFTVTVRGTEPYHAGLPPHRRRLAAALRAAAGVVAVSRPLAALAVELGARPDRVRVIPNGVDRERFRPRPRRAARERLGLPPEAPVLLSVGGLVPLKGFHRVIDVLPELTRQYPGLLFLLVGDDGPAGAWSAALERRARALGVARSVRLVGAQPHPALPDYYAAADVFVLPTLREGSANVLLESLACGTPVVTTAVGGNPETVTSEEAGFLVPPEDTYALKEAVRAALRRRWDPERVAAQVAGRTWERAAAETVAFFGEVTGG